MSIQKTVTVGYNMPVSVIIQMAQTILLSADKQKKGYSMTTQITNFIKKLERQDKVNFI